VKRAALEAAQRAFAGHLRSPTGSAPPAGVETRRMRIYSELIYNNIEGFVAGAFPVLRSLLDDASWHAMVRAFVERHRCQTPYFLEIAEEFLSFLAADAAARDALPPFALELAHYEWIELALDVSEEEIDTPGFSRDGDLMSGVPLLSPLAWPLAYRWPVHRLSASCQPAEPPAVPTFVIVHRREEKVAFLQVDAPTARLVELLDGAEAPAGRAALDRVATEMGGDEAGHRALLASGERMLRLLRERGIVLGTLPGQGVSP